MEDHVIILVGEHLVGKGTMIGFLKPLGYEDFSLSDTIREIAGEGNKDPDSLRELADGFRKKDGPSVMAVLTLQKVNVREGKKVFDGIRHPAEIEAIKEYFKELGKVTDIIAVKCDDEVAYARSPKRSREGDPQTLEDFIRLKKAEARNLNPYQLQVEECIKMADYEIWNNSTDENIFEKEIENLLARMEGDRKRGVERK